MSATKNLGKEDVMAKVAREEKMKDLQKKLEDGVVAVFDSDMYKTYLATMAKFPNYSINNCVLIASQCPEASLVCGFNKWKKDFHRNVNRGEKGIMILAPISHKETVEKEVKDESGEVKKQSEEIDVTSFRPVYVFDISQTSGEPLPSLCESLDDSVDNYFELSQILEKVSPCPISYEPISGGAKGYYSPAKQMIVSEPTLGEMQTVKTLIHEISHA